MTVTDNVLNYSAVQPPHPMVEFLVKHRVALACLVLAVTIALAMHIPAIQVDSTLRDFYVPDQDTKKWNQLYCCAFGNDEYILITIRNNRLITDAGIIESTKRITDSLSEIAALTDVQSISNLSTFQNKNGLFGVKQVITRNRIGTPKAPTIDELGNLRQYLPFTQLLFSSDFKTVGIVARIDDSVRFGFSIDPILQKISETVTTYAAPDSDVRIVGLPVARHAYLKYNLWVAVNFSLLATLVGTIVVVYIFRSLRVTATYFAVVVISLVCMLGLMSVMGIRINTGTSLSFGIILVVSIATIIHVITHFDKAFAYLGHEEKAIKQSLTIVGAPCLMCALTTAAGFASIMISSVPMVRQVGLIMSVGVLASFALVIFLAPLFLSYMKPVSPSTYRRIEGDLVSRGLTRLWSLVLSHPRKCTVFGIVFIVFAATGIPSIKITTDPFLVFHERTPEFKDVEYVQNHLVSIKATDIFIQAEPNVFKKSNTWKKIQQFEQRVRKIPGVESIDSLLPILQYHHKMIMGADNRPDALFAEPGVIQELLHITSFNEGGRRLLRKYVDDQFSRMRLSIRLRNSDGQTIQETLRKIRKVADAELAGLGDYHVVGMLAAFSSQVADLVKSQIYSIILALSIITMLMVIQFRSFALGILSLIPNFLPIATILGVMGWLQIGLDSITVFAATVIIGLSVDDTIHYLTQVKREIRASTGEQDVQLWLTKAYTTTARALTSTSAVLLFAFVTLVFAPFRPLASIGILLSLGILAAIIGDLVLMPSVILTFPGIKRIIQNSAAAEITYPSSSQSHSQ